jgi:outer membrane receptor protein involved in Fe transport
MEGNVIKQIFLPFFFFLITTNIILAQSGKISGNITDAKSGDPLAGANIVVKGTTMGAAANVDGSYYIINVPPGTYTVSASLIGYESVSQTDVEVVIGQTTQIDFKLSETAITTAEVVITANQPVVKKDVSSSQIVVNSQELMATPSVENLTQFMSYQAGVQVTGDIENSEMTIRGGGAYQIGMVVDGLNVSNNLSGTNPVNMITLSSIEQVKVIKGGFNAEYGNIRSGMIDIVTKEGKSQKYSGSINLRYSPAQLKHRGPSLYDWNNYFVRSYVDPAVCWVGTQNGSWDNYTQGQYPQFEGWNKFVQDYNSHNPGNPLTPQQARDIFIWQHNINGAGALGHPNPGSWGNEPDYNIDASFGGPVPFINEALGNLAFFSSYTHDYVAYTYPTEIPAVTTDNGMFKLNSEITPRLKIIGEFFYQKSTNSNSGGAGGAGSGGGSRINYFPDVMQPIDNYQQVFGITINHVLSDNTFYTARLSYVSNWTNERQPEYVRNTTILKTIGQYQLDEEPNGWLNRAGYVYALADQMVIGGIGGGEFNQNSIKTLDLKLDLSSQLDKYNFIQTGIEFISDKYHVDNGINSFDPTGNTLTQWDKTPHRFQGYLQDKLEFEGFIANIGLRADYLDPNTLWYQVDPYSQYYSKVFKSQFIQDVPDTAAETHLYWEPRIGISHPITASSKLYFNYGHFYSLPNVYTMYNLNYGLPSTGIADIGNPNLKPARTIAYELGYEQELFENILVRLTGYYKDITNESGPVQYINYDQSVNYTTYANDHYSDSKGFELELRRNYGQWITGWLNYTYLVTEDGLVGREVQYQDPRLQAVYGLRNPIVNKPLARPYLNANINIESPVDWGPMIGQSHILGQISLNFLITYLAGDYLTWEPVAPYTAQNNLEWKSQWNVDLRISKYFNVAGMDFSAFLNIYNVFDLKYLTGGGFSDANDFRDYMNSLHLPIYSEAKYKSNPQFVAGNDQVGDYRSADKPYINMPNEDSWAWNPPRSLQIGIRASF